MKERNVSLHYFQLLSFWKCNAVFYFEFQRFFIAFKWLYCAPAKYNRMWISRGLSSLPRTNNESRLIASVQSYLIVINCAGRMLIVAPSHYDFTSIRRARNICIRLINRAKDSANPPTDYNECLTSWMKDKCGGYVALHLEFCKIGLEGNKLNTITELFNVANINEWV